MRQILRLRPCPKHGAQLRMKNTSSFILQNGYLSTSSPAAVDYTTGRLYCSTNRISSVTALQKQPKISPYQRRSFINIPDLFSNSNNKNKPQSSRTLRASRTLPFPPSPLYNIIASVESYADFLPFLTASTVTARDAATGYPSQAFLTVGYGPLTETFTSKVTCDKANWIVQAQSGGGIGDDGQPIPGVDEGIFSHLSTKWQLVPRDGTSSNTETEVNLEIRFRFQNPVHTVMMSAVEDKVAGVMIEAFERRIKEQMTLGR